VTSNPGRQTLDGAEPNRGENWFGGNVLELFSLRGKRTVVTGAGRGIGQAIAIGMAQAGASVVLTSRTVEQLESTKLIIETNGGTAHAIPADLTCPEAIPGLVDAAEELLGGTIEIVAHSAGVQHREAAATFPTEAWNKVLQVNLFAPFLLSQEIGRRQIRAGIPGNHVFVASLASVIGLENAIGYNAAKSGVMGVVRGLAREWARAGIRVNAIGPGYIRTAMTADLIADDTKRTNLLRQIPMERFGVPQDFSAPAVFLASEASRYMTGHLLFVDGGSSTI
jgi:2-dehydro-3-deoxy-D-gluconate 5-dehydrogenase